MSIRAVLYEVRTYELFHSLPLHTSYVIFIAKLSLSFNFNLTELVFNVNFPQPPTHSQEFRNIDDIYHN